MNSNASDVDIKPKLSEAHMADVEGSLISQEEEAQEGGSGKSTPMVLNSKTKLFHLNLVKVTLILNTGI